MVKKKIDESINKKDCRNTDLDKEYIFGGRLRILSKIHKEHREHIVFSSTAATYGEAKIMPITEDMLTEPTNTYGETKLAIEKMMKWTRSAHGLNYMCLRYFNVAGADATGMIGEHIIQRPT